VVVDAVLESGIEDAGDVTVADERNLRVSPGRLENQDVFLARLSPNRNVRQFEHGGKHQDRDAPQRCGSRPKA